MTQHLAYADWTASEYWALARCALTGGLHRGDQTDALRDVVQRMYAPSQVWLVNYAHHGLALALRVFQAQCPDRHEVVVPAYICPSVPESITALGLRVRFVDVQPDLNLSVEAVRQALGPDTLAVVTPHMFGCPAPIAALEALCQQAGVFLVDDAAQVVGVRVHGRLLGTFGDAGIISFAQSKTIVTGIRGSGGVLLINRPQWAAAVAEAWAHWPVASGRCLPILDFLWNHLWQPVTGNSGYYLDRLRAAMGHQVGGRPAGPARMGNAEAAVALVQWRRLDDLLAAKRRVVALYADAIRGLPEVTMPQFAPDRYLARVMLALPEGESAARVRSVLASRGVVTRLGYGVPPELSDACPQAWRVAQRLLGVPTRAGMTSADVATIGEAIRDALTSGHTAR